MKGSCYGYFGRCHTSYIIQIEFDQLLVRRNSLTSFMSQLNGSLDHLSDHSIISPGFSMKMLVRSTIYSRAGRVIFSRAYHERFLLD